jgi:lipopolysaccharide transport system ATP-binding protein
MHNAIVVDNLGKWFNRYHTEKPVTIMEAALAGLRRMHPLERFWALRHVSFTVAAGEMLGVLGHNGAGKSTLLQLIGGIGYANEGHVRVNGRIGALLDLGSGFHGDLTGRENTFVNAIVAGLTEREVSQRIHQIVEFAELADFIDNPVRTYSTGMQMRLAFSIAVHTEPEVLLVDEFLSVGDLAFQSKCLDRIQYLKSQGCAIIFISHDANQVERLCDRALWLKKGTVMAYGEPKVVSGQYTSEMRRQTRQRTPKQSPKLSSANTKLKIDENRFGSLEVEILAVRLLPQDILKPGAALTVEIDYETNKPLKSAIFSVAISQDNGDICFEVNTFHQSLPDLKLQERGTIRLVLNRLDLRGGTYFVDVGCYQPDWEYAYDFHWHVYPLTIDAAPISKGILAPPIRWEAGASVVTKP